MKRRTHRPLIAAAAALAIPAALVLPAAPAATAATTVTIDPAIHGERFDGWGTSLAWSANYTGDWDNRDELADLLFSADPDAQSLGLTIARYNIGGGDNPANAGELRPGADVPGYLAGPDADYDWSADPRQRWWLEAARDRVGEDDFVADAIAYSAPYWMTQSGRSSGNVDGSQDNLLPGYEPQFAAYLADVVEHFSTEEGIDFRVLSPLNEPSTDYWSTAGRQEGMHVSPGENQRRILDATYEALAERGLDTGLSAVDETSIDLSISDLRALRDAGFDLDRVDQINTHTYSGGDRAALRQIAVGSGQKRLQMSEVTIGGGAYDPQSIDPSLAFAAALTTDLKQLQPSEWVYWQALESEAESIAGDGNWGLVHYSSDGSEDYEVTRKFSAMRQYSNFIRPGAQLVWNSASNAVTSMNEAGDELTIVGYNNGSSALPMTFDLSAFGAVGDAAAVYRTSADEERAALDPVAIGDDALAVELPAKSVTTFVVPVEPSSEPAIGNGDFERGLPGQELTGWLTDGGDAYGSQIEADYTQSGGIAGGAYEAVHYGGSDFSVRTYQQVAVAPGEYVLRAEARSNGGADRAVMVARTAQAESEVPIPGDENYAEIAIEGIVATDGEIEVAFETSAPGGSWVTFDNVRLERAVLPVETLSVATDAADLRDGDTARFTVTALDRYGQPVADAAAGAVLTSSRASDVVAGTEVTFAGAGVRTVTATLSGDQPLSASVEVSVAASQPAPPETGGGSGSGDGSAPGSGSGSGSGQGAGDGRGDASGASGTAAKGRSGSSLAATGSDGTALPWIAASAFVLLGAGIALRSARGRRDGIRAGGPDRSRQG